MNSQLEQTAEAVQQYIEANLFDKQRLMYSGIDVFTNKPFLPEDFTPAKVPRRAEFDPWTYWTYWTYEDTIIGHGLYIDALMRRYEATGDAESLKRAHQQWLVVRNVFSCSQVWGIGSFLRPYGGYEGMSAFVEPLGTDQASPLFSGLYLLSEYSDAAIRAEIADVMLKTLSWYEQQNFSYFYYKFFIHEWNATYQHAASYYLSAIAWAAKQTGDEKWQRHLNEKMALFEKEEFKLFGVGQGSFCWGSDLVILADALGDNFSRYISPKLLDESYQGCRERLSEYSEPGSIKRIHPESAQPGFQPYLRPGYDRSESMGFAYFFSVHGGRQRPRHEVHYMCALAALRYPGAFEQAEQLLMLRSRVPQDFTDYLLEDYEQLPDEVNFFARSVGTGLVEWLRNYWLLRSVERTFNGSRPRS